MTATDPEVRRVLGIRYCPTCRVDTIPHDDGWCYFCGTQIVGEPKPRQVGPYPRYATDEERVSARRQTWRESQRRTAARRKGLAA